MQHYLLLACSGICIAAAQAVEYGSITLPQDAQSETVVLDYATRLCEKRAALPSILLNPGKDAQPGHIACVAGERRTGDIFSQLEAGRLHINYRLE